MGGAQQPASGVIEKAVRLVVHLHGHMGAAIQIGMHLSLEADGECAAGMTRVDHVERHGIPPFLQGIAGAQNDAFNGQRHTSRA